ncbi:glycosyltransferase [Marinobacterium rhizophilum]|uniref:glycosyltransferase n=1 Tax=Marinobacterium rhizophilum TaxID=420402 RepID=UPI0003785E4E|nr:glycosyltransferase [Marinobacterium rhizophilum]
MTDSPIRVAQVLAGAAQGGAENFFVRLVAGLHEHPSLEVKAFIRDHAHRIDSLRQAGVDTEGFRFGSSLDLLDRHRFRTTLRQYAPEIVMTWMGRASAYTPHSRDYTLVSRLGHYYKLKYYSHADYWVGISKGICKHMIEGGFPADRVVHIPNFADEREVEPLARDSFSTPTDRPLILAAGRLHVNKAFDVLLHSLTELPDVTLWLAGSGPEEQNLKALCAKLGLESRVRFLGWRTDVTALMRTADLFVCPSRHEGLGSIVMESWAHRCPIVATNSQGPGESITDGVSGLITPIDDATALAKAVASVLKSNELRQRLIDGASEVYANGYSKAHIVQRYADFYQQIRSNR